MFGVRDESGQYKKNSSMGYAIGASIEPSMELSMEPAA